MQWQRDDVASPLMLRNKDNLLTLPVFENLLLAHFTLIFSLEAVFLFTLLIYCQHLR